MSKWTRAEKNWKRIKRMFKRLGIKPQKPSLSAYSTIGKWKVGAHNEQEKPNG